MTTPALNTPTAIIRDAYVDAGLNAVGEEPDNDQVVAGMSKLTDLVNWYQTKGLKLWLNVDTPIPLTVGQATYVLAPGGDVDMTKPLRVIQAYNLDVNNIRRPLTVLSWNDYLTLSQVSGNNGQINSYFVNKQATQLDVTFWLTPDAEAATGVAHVLLQRQVTNFINVTETMDFPMEWRIALRWGLADELATGQPPAIMARCAQRAEQYRVALEDWDVEDAPTQFQPDSRAQYSTSRFR